MLELGALFLVGLALFFHGVGGIRTNLQGLTSRRLRRRLARWSRHPVLAGAWGFVFGAVTQSSTAVAFIVTSLVSSGLMDVARALPIVAWANLGTVVLVFFVSFHLHLAFLYLLGVAGIALAFGLGSARLRPALTASFCVGLLFFGLRLMRDAFAPLPQFGWFKDVAAFLHGSLLAVFVAGALLRVLVQSSSGIAVIAIALAHGGLLTPDQAALMMFGTGAGVGLSIFLLAANLRGIPRQIALYQALINAFAGLTLGGLAAIEQLTGAPLVLALTRALASDLGLRLAWAFLCLQATAVGAAQLGARAAPGGGENQAPPTAEQDMARAPYKKEQDLARPRYLTEHALDDPESALELAEKEQLRLLGHLPAQLDTVRAETAAQSTVPAETWHRATLAVSGEVQTFLHDIAERQPDHAASERLLALERRQTLVLALDETVFSFVTTLGQWRVGGTPVSALVDSLVESLTTLVHAALDALRSDDPEDAANLAGMTADRGALMEQVRRSFVGGPQPIDHQQKTALFYLTSLFERAVWLLRQLGQTLLPAMQS
jgi:phosphate:Na+ symporter